MYFGDVSPCSFINGHWCFGRTCCHIFRIKYATDGHRMFFRNISTSVSHYTVPPPKRHNMKLHHDDESKLNAAQFDYKTTTTILIIRRIMFNWQTTASHTNIYCVTCFINQLHVSAQKSHHRVLYHNTKQNQVWKCEISQNIFSLYSPSWELKTINNCKRLCEKSQ